jgi:hypothetical protein
LRVDAAGDAVAARQFDRTLKDAAATSLHAPGRRVDVADAEVVEPKGDRNRRGLGEHAAERLTADGEILIRAHRVDRGVRFLPAKKVGVEGKRLVPIAGQEFVPANAARCSQLSRLFRDGVQPPQQNEGRHLRVGDECKTADVGDICRWDMHRSAKKRHAFGRGVDVIDADIAEPLWRRAGLPRLLGQVHHPADGRLADGEQDIGRIGHRGVLRAPTKDVGVEGLSGRHVGRHQLVPEETAM